MLTFRTISSILLTLITLSGFAADIIIESRPKGQNHDGYRETAGRWLSSNTPPQTSKSSAPGLTPQGELGSRKATVYPGSNAAPDAVVSAARFTPKIETAGDYHVYLTFPKAANATPITVLVKSANGEEKKEISQDGWGANGAPNGNRWLEIGTFPFTTAGGQYVEIQVTGATGATDPVNPPQAFADAVRFSTEPLAKAQDPAPAVAGKTPAPDPTPAPTTAAAPNNDELDWASDLATARAIAGKENKKVFVYFYSPQSSRSTDYEKNVINDPKVKGVIKASFIPVKINMDTERGLSSQLQVFRAGTINIYEAATGNGLEHVSDTPNPDELVKRLNAVK